ncbi:hypothetical protein C0991_010464 [Blastosporella zonata]|nr:hypothetical protein C0991_010464 [Blastosporella zonata]
MLGGTGLTFINNVGSISQALYTKSVNVYDPTDAARWQADQVSSISILNFFGRIFIGLVSDFAKNRLHFPRSYSLVLVAFLFLLSQVLAAFVIDDIKHLWIVSATLGLAHGSAFSLFPNVCLEWFGMRNIFSFVFGHILDAHESFNVSPKTKVALTSSVMSATTTATATATGTCTLGRECYVFAVYLTTGACFVSTLLSLWAGWRDKKRLAAGVRMAPA